MTLKKIIKSLYPPTPRGCFIAWRGVQITKNKVYFYLMTNWTIWSVRINRTEDVECKPNTTYLMPLKEPKIDLENRLIATEKKLIAKREISEKDIKDIGLVETEALKQKDLYLSQEAQAMHINLECLLRKANDFTNKKRKPLVYLSRNLLAENLKNFNNADKLQWTGLEDTILLTQHEEDADGNTKVLKKLIILGIKPK